MLHETINPSETESNAGPQQVFFTEAQFKEMNALQSVKEIETRIRSDYTFYTIINYLLILFVSIGYLSNSLSDFDSPTPLYYKILQGIEILAILTSWISALIAKQSLSSRMQTISLILQIPGSCFIVIVGLLVPAVSEILYENMRKDDIPDSLMYVFYVLMLYYCITSYGLIQLMKKREKILRDIENKKFI